MADTPVRTMGIVGLVVAALVFVLLLFSGGATAHDHMNCANDLTQQQETCIHEPTDEEIFSQDEDRDSDENTHSSTTNARSHGECEGAFDRAAQAQRVGGLWTKTESLNQYQDCRSGR